ncbi:MAG: response regulator [Betaproteobacteria bacterium]|nr:response regulator [Betaproteobacteria bacterium]
MAKDPYRFFRVEARELLDQLAKTTLDLEKSPATAEQVSRLLRLAHTLKGAARVVKQREVSDLAHAVEDALAPYRDSGKEIPREHIDGVLATLDAITARLAQLPAPPGEESATAPGTTAEPINTVRAEVAEVDALLDGLGEVHGEVATLRRAMNSAARARDLAALLADQLATPRLADTQRSAGPAASFIKARSLAEELHTAIADLERNVAGSVERVDRELRQARELTEGLRLVPAGTIFNALERVARDAAHGAGKRVVFETNGGDTRLDGHVLDAVQSALVQLVRNAVAHGVEPEGMRARAGKPVDGRVMIEVTRRGHRVSFICRDDGRGVDLEAVRRALERNGALSRDTESLGAAELLQRLLRGGITTSGAVTELSGRGIGLDVVREIADRLGGEVLVQTADGSGTTVELRAPVSLASLEVLIVETGGEAAAIPLDAVRATLRVAARDISHAPEGDAIVHQDRLIPLVSLAPSVMNRNKDSKTNGDGRAISAVIVAGATATAAVAVDRLLGTETITLRPLPRLAPAAAVVSGVHIDAEGNPRPVLNPEAIVSPAYRSAARELGPAAAAHPILVIDDSLTTRMLEQSILESAGFEVELATSGEEALDKAHANHFGLFLVDVEMPGMDGFTFIERSRADPLLRNVPCILVTSRESAEDRKRGEAAGAGAYIVKSEFDQVDFLDRIARLIRQ